jgi:hypothetical protein
MYQLCKIWGFRGGDYEECLLARYKKLGRTSQETHYVSATEPSQFLLSKIWGFHGGDKELFKLLLLLAHTMSSEDWDLISIPEDGILLHVSAIYSYCIYYFRILRRTIRKQHRIIRVCPNWFRIWSSKESRLLSSFIAPAPLIFLSTYNRILSGGCLVWITCCVVSFSHSKRMSDYCFETSYQFFLPYHLNWS